MNVFVLTTWPLQKLNIHHCKPEEMFSHTVTDHFIIGIQFKCLFIAVKQVLNPCQRIQFFCPFKESKLKCFLENKAQTTEVLGAVRSRNWALKTSGGVLTYTWTPTHEDQHSAVVTESLHVYIKACSNTNKALLLLNAIDTQTLKEDSMNLPSYRAYKEIIGHLNSVFNKSKNQLHVTKHKTCHKDLKRIRINKIPSNLKSTYFDRSF